MTPLALIIVISLFLLWNLEFIATLLNLKTFPSNPPAELDGLMDQEKLDRAHSYLKTNSRFDLIRSTTSLAILLAFWFLHGFPLVDDLARSLVGNEIVAGMVFLSILFVAQNLVSLPFDYYETFVIEQRFGFNKSSVSTFIVDRFKGLALAAILGPRSSPVSCGSSTKSRTPGSGPGPSSPLSSSFSPTLLPPSFCRSSTSSRPCPRVS